MIKIPKKLFIALVFSLFLTSLFRVDLFSSAQSIELQSGAIVRISGGDTVYYFAQDERMYVFPNSLTFYSWYDDFGAVLEISPEIFYRYPLGGIVKYRPGKVMLKTPSNNRVYAVTQNGELRWMSDASLAQHFYGENWMRLVDDVPDSIFTNYDIGEQINETSDYNPDREQRAVPSINHNLGLIARENLGEAETDELALRCSFLEQATETLRTRANRYSWSIWNLGHDYAATCDAGNNTNPEPIETPIQVSQIRIIPEDVGVFVESAYQQFSVEGLDPDGEWVNITPYVSWGLSDYNFASQSLGAEDILDINQDGLATLKHNWGRANVNACYPAGCQGNSIQASPLNTNTSLTIVNVSIWGYWLGDSVSSSIPLDQYRCMSVPEARYYQVTEYLHNSSWSSEELQYDLVPGATFSQGWGKLWTISSQNGGRTYSAFAWDWTTTNRRGKGLGGVRSVMADPWKGTMLTTICDHRDCTNTGNPVSCNGRRRSTINFAYHY